VKKLAACPECHPLVKKLAACSLMFALRLCPDSVGLKARLRAAAVEPRVKGHAREAWPRSPQKGHAGRSNGVPKAPKTSSIVVPQKLNFYAQIRADKAVSKNLARQLSPRGPPVGEVCAAGRSSKELLAQQRGQSDEVGGPPTHRTEALN
jgi:hypothetical protein